MMSHHVTCHVTAISCASSLSLKEKEKEIQKKSRKIDKKKKKNVSAKAFHNTIAFVTCSQLFCIPIRNSSTCGISI